MVEIMNKKIKANTSKRIHFDTDSELDARISPQQNQQVS